jgi:uncharacterized protein YdaU (DUF1376 family)
MKDPAFLFYSSDFLTGTMFFTDEQVGQYIRLLCAQHQKGRLSEKDMLHICKSYDKDIFSKFTKDADGNFYNDRLEVEINKRKEYTESRRNNRLKGIENKKNKPSKQKSYDTSYVEHMENEIEDINVIDKKNKRSKAFKPNFETLPEWMQSPLIVWHDYKKAKKENYVEVGWNALITKLQSEFTNERDLAIAVNNSMAHNWKGIFKPQITKTPTDPMHDDLTQMDYSKPF